VFQVKENSIEEDIEVIESIIEEYENCCVPEIDMQVNVTFREKQNNALNHILSDYKRVLKENERLQKENEELREDRDKFKKALGKRITYCNELEKDLFENCSNYVIPIQTIKDKIEKYKKMLLSCNRFSDVDRIKAINERILELEELLEGRK
jgi:hypothetical protein